MTPRRDGAPYRSSFAASPNRDRTLPTQVLTVRISKGKDARDLLVCEREDGTSTWHRVSDGMPVHDLTHLAVESTLGLADAFYGLVADGWDIESFAVPGASRRLPGIALWTEVVVFLLQTEFANGILQDPASFNGTLAAIGGAKHLSYSRHLSPEELETIRGRVRGWCDEWSALEPGGELVFKFEPGTEGVERVAAH